MDRPAFFDFHRSAIVDRIAQQIEHAAQRCLADGHRHRTAGVDHFHAANHAVGTGQSDAPHAAAAQVLLHFAGEVNFGPLHVGIDRDGVIDLRQMVFGKLHVERGADDLRHLAGVLGGGRFAARLFRGCSCSCHVQWFRVQGSEFQNYLSRDRLIDAFAIYATHPFIASTPPRISIISPVIWL